MICSNCKAEVPASFEHAIANNQCPRCGSEIMSADKMEAFKFLKKDLGKIQMSMNAEETMDRIIAHLIENYQIRPLKPLDVSEPTASAVPAQPMPSISSRQPGMPAMPADTGNPDIDNLKREVYKEMMEQQREMGGGISRVSAPMPGESDGVVWDDGDEGELVERLKAKAKGGNKFINKQGTRVQRLD